MALLCHQGGYDESGLSDRLSGAGAVGRERRRLARALRVRARRGGDGAVARRRGILQPLLDGRQPFLDAGELFADVYQVVACRQVEEGEVALYVLGDERLEGGVAFHELPQPL